MQSLAPPKRPLRDQDEPSPDVVAVPGGGGTASPDHLYNIYQRLTTIESTQAFVVAAVDDSKTKIENVAKEVAEMKAMLRTVKPIAKSVAAGIWTLVCGVAAFLLTVAGMWMKHHFGW